MGNIRWRKSELKDLQKKINNYNAKIKRLQKKNYAEDLLPEKISFAKIRDSITNREDYKRELELIKSFTNRYSENIAFKSDRGAKIPVFMKKQIEIKLKQINKLREEEKSIFGNLEATDRGKGMGVKAIDTSLTNIHHLNPKQFKKEHMSRKDLWAFNESLKEYDIKKDKRYSMYKSSYYKAIYSVFGDGLGEDKAEELIEILEQLPPEKIIEKYYTDINMDIDFIYERVDLILRYEALMESWSSTLKKYEEEGE